MDRKLFGHAACSLLWLALSTSLVSADQPVLEGRVPDYVDAEKVNLVWEFVKQLTLTNSHMPPPRIRFVYSDCGSGSVLLHWQKAWVAPPELHCETDKDWIDWKEDWHKKNPSIPYPFSDSLLGYHFEGTNVIQVARKVFPNEQTGQGYRVLGHEMLHYVFDGKVESREQHCFFRARNYFDLLTSFLIETGIGTYELRVPRTDFVMGEGCDNSGPASRR